MPLRHDMRRAVICMVAAHGLFAAMGAVVKHLSAEFPVVQLMFFRSAFALPVIALIAWQAGGMVLRTRRLGAHALRACTGISAQSLGFYALAFLPLAEQTALGYTQPLFVTLLAIPFLGEKVGWHRGGAVLLGFAGVLVIACAEGLGGGAAPPLAGTVAAVAQGMFSAVTTMLVRSLSATESSTTITLWQSILMTAFALVLLPFFWVTPGWAALGLLVLVGLVGGMAQWLLTEAWASAQVSAISPWSYVGLLWSSVFGLIAFGDRPGPAMLAGSALIVGAGLLILRRETRRRAGG